MISNNGRRRQACKGGNWKCMIDVFCNEGSAYFWSRKWATISFFLLLSVCFPCSCMCTISSYLSRASMNQNYGPHYWTIGISAKNGPSTIHQLFERSQPWRILPGASHPVHRCPANWPWICARPRGPRPTFSPPAASSLRGSGGLRDLYLKGLGAARLQHGLLVWWHKKLGALLKSERKTW